MFSNLFLKSFRILLLPFSFLYWIGISIRNLLYKLKIFKTASFALPIIGVGNLAVGGTGKSPMVEYLVTILKDKYKVATISRGYKRKTRGYSLANNNSTALDIGDEPMQFHLKFPDIPVAVGEQRLVAIPQLLHDRPMTEAIIMDDSFQHRAIRPGLNILLTEFSNLFVHDFYLPSGDLRDLKSGYKRADIIVVTKCDPLLNEAIKERTIRQIRPLNSQKVFFTSIEYGQPYHIINKSGIKLDATAEVLLVSGIANPGPLQHWVEHNSTGYKMMRYPDHYIFTIDDFREIKIRFSEIEENNKLIITTEKDAVRLLKFKDELKDLPVYVVPVKHHFLFEEGNEFNEQVISFIRNFKQHQN